MNIFFKKNVLLKRISLLTIVSLLLLVSFNIIFWLSEHYYFDILLYKKSWFHGYYYQSEPSFFKRLLGIMNADNFRGSENIKPDTKDTFTIAIIGDSMVQGVGVRAHQAFPYLLEKKLNTIKKTNVINLGVGGASFLDYFETYNKIIPKIDPDLVIFAFYENDLFINQWQYEAINNSTNQCNNFVVYFNYDTAYEDKVSASLTQQYNNINYFLNFETPYHKEVPHLIYYITYLPFVERDEIMVDLLTKKYGSVITNQDVFEKNYAQLGDTLNEKVESDLKISAKEGHPNKTAHQMFASKLYQEITQDSTFGFIFQ